MGYNNNNNFCPIQSGIISNIRRCMSVMPVNCVAWFCLSCTIFQHSFLTDKSSNQSYMHPCLYYTCIFFGRKKKAFQPTPFYDVLIWEQWFFSTNFYPFFNQKNKNKIGNFSWVVYIKLIWLLLQGEKKLWQFLYNTKLGKTKILI
jgi:hypothetical protein